MADLSNLFAPQQFQTIPENVNPFELHAPKAAEFKRRIALREAMKAGIDPNNQREFVSFMGQRLAQLNDGEGATMMAQQLQALDQQELENQRANRGLDLEARRADETERNNRFTRAARNTELGLQAQEAAQNARLNERELRGEVSPTDEALIRQRDAAAMASKAQANAANALAEMRRNGKSGNPDEIFQNAFLVEQALQTAQEQLAANPTGVTGVVGALKSMLGGLARQVGAPVPVDAEEFRASLVALAGQAGPFLLQDNRALSVTERERVEKMISEPKYHKDAESQAAQLRFLEDMIEKVKAYNAGQGGGRTTGAGRNQAGSVELGGGWSIKEVD